MTPLAPPRRHLMPSLAFALALIAIALLPVADAPRHAHAAGMVVNTLADANPPATDGLCSLREAITNANDNAATFPDCPAGAGADTITFSVSGTVVLAASLPDITDGPGLVIDGSGQNVVVSGNNAVRMLKVEQGATLHIRVATLTEGKGTPCGSRWGSLCNLGELTLEKAHVSRQVGDLLNEGVLTATESSITDFSGGSYGAGVYNKGIATFTKTSVRNNTGSGITNEGTLTVVGGGITDNGIGYAGGGIRNTGSATVDAAVVQGNRVLFEGGGIFNYRTGTLVVRGSLIRGNRGGSGGGIYNEGSLNVANSTLSENTAAGSGGIRNHLAPPTLINVSIVGNTGGISTTAGATLLNTILANVPSAGTVECNGTLNLTGPNLIGATTGCTITGTPPIVADPLLAPLADNGGPTWTHALLPGSPALGAGDPAVCAAGPVSGLDQRGVARPQGAGCDLGAYEATPVGGKHLRVSAPAGSIALGWDSGFSQTGYTLLTYNTATASATLTNLPATAVAHTDAAVASGTVYCYVLAATGPSGVLGLSDLVCGLTGLETGTVLPSAFTLSLHGTTNASLTWQAPTGGADSYLLVRIPLDGSAVTNVPLSGSATSSVQPVPVAGSCFQLVAFKGAANGLTNVVCGVPGISTLGAAARFVSMADVERTMGERLTGLVDVARQMAGASTLP